MTEARATGLIGYFGQLSCRLLTAGPSRVLKRIEVFVVRCRRGKNYLNVGACTVEEVGPRRSLRQATNIKATWSAHASLAQINRRFLILRPTLRKVLSAMANPGTTITKLSWLGVSVL